MTLGPLHEFLRIMRFARFMMRCVGADIYDPKYRMNKITGVTIISIIGYAIFTFTTVLKKNNWMFTLQAIVTSGSAIQGVNKLIVALYYAHKIYDLNRMIVLIYKEYEQKSDKRYAEVLLKNCAKLRRVLIFVGITYTIGGGGMVVVPLVYTKITGQLTLMMHFHVAGIDVNTQMGAWITQGLHALCLILGVIGTYAGDMIIVVHLLQSYIFADILRIKVDNINTISEGLETDESREQVMNVLVDIVRWHQGYMTFISKCNDLFSSIVSVQISTAALCIVLTIFVLLTSDWPGGYSYTVVLVPNLYIYCILGTLVETCNDDIMYEIYNISFYNMTVLQQRLVLFMLAKSQQTVMIRVLGVMSLAVSTALQITKNIYSMAMMMVNFLWN